MTVVLLVFSLSVNAADLAILKRARTPEEALALVAESPIP